MCSTSKQHFKNCVCTLLFNYTNKVLYLTTVGATSSAASKSDQKWKFANIKSFFKNGFDFFCLFCFEKLYSPTSILVHMLG